MYLVRVSMVTECMVADKQHVEYSGRNAGLLPAVLERRLTLLFLNSFTTQQHMGFSGELERRLHFNCAHPGIKENVQEYLENC